MILLEIFEFTFDERRQFLRGFADVKGYIRRSNYTFSKPKLIVYFEIPRNWDLVIHFCNLLKRIDTCTVYRLGKLKYRRWKFD